MTAKAERETQSESHCQNMAALPTLCTHTTKHTTVTTVTTKRWNTAENMWTLRYCAWQENPKNEVCNHVYWLNTLNVQASDWLSCYSDAKLLLSAKSWDSYSSWPNKTTTEMCRRYISVTYWLPELTCPLLRVPLSSLSESHQGPEVGSEYRPAERGRRVDAHQPTDEGVLAALQ